MTTTTPAPLYIGTKTVHATPMTRGQYNAYRTWTPPEGEDQTTAGYLVEYADGGAANDSRHVGYISWSPADVFERSYRPAQTFRDRLEIERDEVSLRTGKLDAYIGTVPFNALSARAQHQLRDQFAAMKEYLGVLLERIGDLSVQPPVDNAHVAPGCEQFGESSGPVSA